MTAAIQRGMLYGRKQSGNRSQQQINMANNEYYASEQRNILINEGESFLKIETESAVKQKLIKKSLNNRSARPMTAIQSTTAIRRGVQLRNSMGTRMFKRAINHITDHDEPTVVDVHSQSNLKSQSPQREPIPAPELDKTTASSNIPKSVSSRVLQDFRVKNVSSMSTFAA